MPDIVIHGIASAAYLVLAWHFWNTRWRAGAVATSLQPWERAVIVVPLALHGALLYHGLFTAAELRFGFAQALSVMLFLAVLMCWLEAFLYPIEALYPLVLAAAAICAPLPAVLPRCVSPDAVPFVVRLHPVFCMLDSSLFTAAMLQDVLYRPLDIRLQDN